MVPKGVEEGQALLPLGPGEEERRPAAWRKTAVRVASAFLAVGAIAGLVSSDKQRAQFSVKLSSKKAAARSDLAASGDAADDLVAFNAVKAKLAPKKSQTGLTVADEYSRKFGREIMDGMLGDAMPYLIQVHKPTTLTSDEPGEHMWVIDGEDYNDGEPVDGSIEFTFTEVGEHTVAIADLNQEFTVHVKRVRRELRDLSEVDRERFFDAVQTMYTTGTKDGRLLYGKKYRSARYFIEEHLNGAADKTCDHWHDDAGIANHHIAFTWEFENSLVSVDPTTAVHYWDYTRDAAKESDTDDAAWKNINIFDEKWYGPVDNEGELDVPGQYIVSQGRFAYLSVEKTESSTTAVTNPFGLLRSPWNTNPTPFLMRHSKVLGVVGDGFTTYPSCTDFEGALEEKWLGKMLYEINGLLHGPLHLMVGGHWGFPTDVEEWVKNNFISGDVFLLLSKFLWRQGYIRLPETCSMDSVSDCVASCPDAIIRGRTAVEIFKESGVEGIWSNYGINPFDSELGGKLETILSVLCRVGYPGELFTSAAPQDPLFWSLHGNSERFLMLARLLKTSGVLDFSERWGYSHEVIASDTNLVCDWSDVSGMEMPTCSRGTCPGHKEDDLLPFKTLLKDQDQEFTNAEMYDMLYPTREELPYVFDSVLYWKACSAGTIAS